MSDDADAGARLETGVPGLDRVLGGGLPRNGVYIVEGTPGSGKTILGSQISYHQAARGAQVVYLTLLAESHSQMLQHLRRLRFFRKDLVASHVHYVSGFKALEGDGLSGLVRLMRDAVTARGASLLVLDGLVSALDSAPSSRDFKKFVHELQTVAAMTQCTLLLLASTDRGTRSHPEHTMVDGIIELSENLDQLRALRQLRVRKLRSSDPVRGRHTLSITSDGVSIRPRVESDLLRLPEDAPLVPGAERVKFGIEALDQMLGGGVPARSTTMTIGPSGCGKSLLGLQFLSAGAKTGELGLYFGFYERPQSLLLKADRIGLELSGLHRRGQVQLLWEPYGERDIDSLADRLLTAIREFRPARLFLDGLHGFQQSADNPERLGSVFSALAEEFEARHLTSLYTVESPDLFGPVITSPIRGVSAVTHNILLLRYAEVDNQIRRLISVLKLRDSGHDPSIREFIITDTGLSVEDNFKRATGMLTGLARPRSSPELRHSDVAPVPKPAGPGLDARGRRTILIVDDEFGLADVMAEILTESGYQTFIAINGELGMRAVREHKPDLLLLDMMMPVLSGAEMLKLMKSEPELSQIPVVLMTAFPEAISGAARGLAAAVLQKPFAPNQLFEVVGQVLGHPA